MRLGSTGNRLILEDYARILRFFLVFGIFSVFHFHSLACLCDYEIHFFNFSIFALRFMESARTGIEIELYDSRDKPEPEEIRENFWREGLLD